MGCLIGNEVGVRAPVGLLVCLSAELTFTIPDSSSDNKYLWNSLNALADSNGNSERMTSDSGLSVLLDLLALLLLGSLLPLFPDLLAELSVGLDKVVGLDVLLLALLLSEPSPPPLLPALPLELPVGLNEVVGLDELLAALLLPDPSPPPLPLLPALPLAY